ncbi:MAG: 50S ribosomal protein L25/general stress protein Ctc [Rhodospirillaceae bacterium]|nr:50S ribosomal protein L25/general stress protein Ctc [Rhodospirillaceae bacterium]|tara:strand:+ start:296 stop:1003 length:708 start_codon:yes stop_codon:yes gene_type:complete
MSTAFDLEVNSREGLGKGHSRRLRRQGKVPAVLYGGGESPAAIFLEHDKLIQQMENEAFQTSIITLNMGTETQSVVVKDIQRHPSKRRVLHLDFQRILADEKITLIVPIHYSGQEVAIGVKEQGGEVAILISDVEISCLPKDLPEFLELDISSLELNQRMSLSDIKPPEGVDILALTQEQNPSIVTINPPRQEEEDEIPELAEGIVETEDGEPIADSTKAEPESPPSEGTSEDSN